MKIVLYIIAFILSISVIWYLLSVALPCPAWLAWLVERDNPFCRINRAQVIIEHLDVKPGMKILDAGCGPGRVTIPLAEKVGPQGHVVALDIQEAMLNKTREKARAAHLHNITYLHAGLGENKLEHNAFDRITLVTVLGEIPNQKAALQELYSALKPGGILSITELIFDPHYQRQSTTLKLTTAAGFKQKQLFGNWVAYTLN